MMATRDLKYAARFESEYLRNTPDGIVEPVDGSLGNSLESSLETLVLHFQNVRSLIVGSESTQTLSSVDRTWKEVIPDFNNALGKHITLSDRGRSCLNKDNPYLRPERMLTFFLNLSNFAKFYQKNKGVLDGNFKDVGLKNFGIEIALEDKSITFYAMKINKVETELFAKPHVKIDDYKTKNECGRIYFAIQPKDNSFVVDHIGIHNYGT